MKKIRLAPILALFLSIACLAACGGNDKNANAGAGAATQNSTSENSNAARTNVEELALLINVPYETIDVDWYQYPKKVMAVLRFSPDDAARVVADAEKFGPAQNVVIEPEVWFSDELTAQSDMSGDNALKGVAYPANTFFQEPYNIGRITRIEGGDYFVLELSAK